MKNNWKHRKKKLKGDLEFEYYNKLVELSSDDEISYTEKELLVEINKWLKKRLKNCSEKKETTQPELSRDLAYLHIKKVRVSNIENKGYVFKYKKNDSDVDLPLDFIKYIAKPSAVMRTFRCLKIGVKKGYENTICSIIAEKFPTRNIIIIPAYSAVCIITNKKSEMFLTDISNSIKKAQDLLKSGIE